MPEREEPMTTAELAEDYSPLRWCSKALQDLADLFAKFTEVEADIRRVNKAMGNGELRWKPPKD